MFDRHHGLQRREAGQADAEGTGRGTHMPRFGCWTWQPSRDGSTSSRCTRWRQFPTEWVAGSGRRVTGALCVGSSPEGLQARSRIESRKQGGSLPGRRLRPNATKYGTDCQRHSAVHPTMCWRADGYRSMGQRSWSRNEAHGSIERRYGGNVVRTPRTRLAEQRLEVEGPTRVNLTACPSRDMSGRVNSNREQRREGNDHGDVERLQTREKLRRVVRHRGRTRRSVSQVRRKTNR